MKKRISKAIALLMVMVITMTTLAGCGGKKDEGSKADNSVLDDAEYELDENTPAWQLNSEEPITLDWYVNADWWDTSYGSDYVTKKIKEDTNITINFITGDDTKLNTLFASGGLPDIVTIMDSASQAARTADKWALPLNSLADQYDPYFYKAISQDSLNWYKLDDGNSYGYPNFSNSQRDYDENLIKATTAFTIRKDVYEAIGEPSMKTQEEFVEALKMIKDKFPELIPLGWWWLSSLSVGLLDYIGVPVETEDGSFYDRRNDEDYLSWIKTLNTAYKYGCINDDIFADDGTGLEEKVQSGKYACMFIDGVPQAASALQSFSQNNPDSSYIAIDGPISTVGNKPALSQSGLSGWMVNYISKDCKDPARAISLFTYLASEYGEMLTYYGIEGDTYTVTEDGLYQFTDEIAQLKKDNYDSFKTTYRFGEFYFFGHDRYVAKSADVIESIAQLQDWGKGKLKTYFVIEQIDPDAGTAEARAVSAIDSNWETTLVSLIRANNDDVFSKVIDEYNKFLKNNSWDKIVEIRSEKMKKNKEKLGLE